MYYKKTNRWKLPNRIVLFVFAVNLLIGIFIVADFGESWDEHIHILYGEDTYHTLQSLLKLRPERVLNPLAPTRYGPVINLGAVMLSVLVTKLQLGSQLSGIHFFYFIVYQIGVLGFYWLARRLLHPWAAVGIMLIFQYQPLFWGHAFMNPKDIPFMSFFILSMVLGIKMVDRLVMEFNLSEKAVSASVGGSIPNMEVKSRGSVFCTLGRFMRMREVLFAGIMVGLCIAIRNLGIFAMFLIITLAVIRLDRKAYLPMGVYLLAGAVVTYLFWPYLWGAPIRNFLISIKIMSNYPWNHTTLFEGVFYRADQLPWYYAPKIFLIQFTEPLVILLILGVVFFISKKSLWELERFLWGIILAWGGLFFVYVMVTRPSMYDNARQLFFITPPIFLLAGLGLEGVFRKISNSIFKGMILLLVLLPGILSIIQLHPFEYIYYNQFVGGVQGANQHYEMDYWFTGFNQVVSYLNTEAPENARILVVEGPDHIVKKYVRPDLVVFGDHEVMENQFSDFNFVILGTRWNADQRYFTSAPIVFIVQSDGVPLIIVKEIF